MHCKGGDEVNDVLREKDIDYQRSNVKKDENMCAIKMPYASKLMLQEL
jgi:hypothetical protein